MQPTRTSHARNRHSLRVNRAGERLLGVVLDAAAHDWRALVLVVSNHVGRIRSLAGGRDPRACEWDQVSAISAASSEFGSSRMVDSGNDPFGARLLRA